MAEKLLTTQMVAERYSIHPRNVEKWEKEGRIPKRVQGWPGHEPRWREATIDAHIRAMDQAERSEQVA
jgi:hypothetical protein